MPTFLVCFYPDALLFLSKLTKVLALTQVMLGVRAIGTVSLYLFLRSSITWSRPLCQWIGGERIWAVKYGQCLSLGMMSLRLSFLWSEHSLLSPINSKPLSLIGSSHCHGVV